MLHVAPFSFGVAFLIRTRMNYKHLNIHKYCSNLICGSISNLPLESQPFGELLKNADQIDFNVKTSDSLNKQWYHNIGLYSLGGSSWMMFGLAIFVIYCVNKKSQNEQIIVRG